MLLTSALGDAITYRMVDHHSVQLHIMSSGKVMIYEVQQVIAVLIYITSIDHICVMKSY